MLNTSTVGDASVNGLIRIPATCAVEDARECASQRIWVRRCCAAISAEDPSIGTDDLLDLATTLWNRPGCKKTCPKMVVASLFADELVSLR